MTKISQDQYIKTIVSKVRLHMQYIIYDEMINKLKMLPDTNDTVRVAETLMNDSIIDLEEELCKYISETGVPRKKRENKEADESSSKKSNAYHEFCKAHRARVTKEMEMEEEIKNKSKNITLKACDVTTRLSEMWNASKESTI